jgi:hypothetical protein
MRIEDHLEQARQWGASAGKLDPEADALALLEIAMMWGTASLNAAMHAAHVTQEHEDLKHARKLVTNERLSSYPADFDDMVLWLEEIETIRSRYCRGEDATDGTIARRETEETAVRRSLTLAQALATATARIIRAASPAQ